MPAGLLGVRPGERVLDLCAAPGGKTSQLAAALRGEGLLVANEYVAARAGVLKSNLERMGVTNALVLNESTARVAAAFPAFFDKVLVDAPCSGLGVIRKKPDIRYKDPKPLEDLPQVQQAILENAAGYVKPGGVLMYSTCTILPRENGEIVSAFLEKHPEFVREAFELPGAAGRVEAGEITLWPQVHQTDGFFICKLRKVGEAP